MDDLELRINDLVERELAEIRDEDIRAEVRAEVTNQRTGESRLWLKLRRPSADSSRELIADDRVRAEAKSGRVDDRILAQSTELFNEISRSRNEAELRAGLLPVLALFAISVYVNVSWSLWLCLMLGFLMAGFLMILLLEAFRYRSRARGIALRAVIDGLVTTPTIDLIRLRARAEQVGTGSSGHLSAIPDPKGASLGVT
jgi:hypothetical protein